MRESLLFAARTTVFVLLCFALFFVLVAIGLLLAGWLTPWLLLGYVPIAMFVYVASVLGLLDFL